MFTFKNAQIFKFEPDSDFMDAMDGIVNHKFTERGTHEYSRSGFVPPVEDDERYIVPGSNCLLICRRTDSADLKNSVITGELDKRVAAIEKDQCRKVYRKERISLKDDVILDLIPRAFNKSVKTYALIKPAAGWIVIDSSTSSKAEDLLSALRDATGSLKVRVPETGSVPSTTMGLWLYHSGETMPPEFAIGRDAKLKEADADGTGTVTYRDQDLYTEEMRHLIDSGMKVVRVGVSWRDQLTFMIHDDLSLHGIKYTDQHAADEDEVDVYTDITQLALELTNLLPDLFEAFGGLSE